MRRLVRFFPGWVVVVAALFPVFLACQSAAYGQELLKNNAPPLQDAKLLPQAEFDALTTLYEDSPGGDKGLSYSLRLPKDWKKSEDVSMASFMVSDKILGEILRFFGPPVLDSRSSFSMQVISLEYIMTAQQWFLQYLLSNGFTIQGIKEIDEKRAEALYVKVDQGITYVIRAVAVINGKRIAMAQYQMPADNWETEKQMQAQVVDSFKLTHVLEEQSEEMRKYHFLDASVFQYPASWQLNAGSTSRGDRMGFEILNVASEEKKFRQNTKTLNGSIHVDIVSYDFSESIESEVANLKEELSQRGLSLGEALEFPVVFKYDAAVKPGQVEVFKLIDAKNSLLGHEYWIIALDVGEYYYFISLITPSRDEDYFVWARNVEAYKLVIELFQPVAG